MSKTYAVLMEFEDIEWMRRMHNEASTLLQLTDARHISQVEQKEWFKKMSLSKTSNRYVIWAYPWGDNTIDGACRVGVIRVDNMDTVNRSVMVGVDVEKNYRRKGYASWAYEWILDYMFNELGMNRVYLKVLDTNEAAHNLYCKLGFTEEGRERQAIFRGGKWHDYILMSMLKDEYDYR